MKKVYINAYLSKNLGDDLFVKVLVERYRNSFYTYSTKKYVNHFGDNLHLISGFPIKILKKMSVVFFKENLVKKILEKSCDCVITIGGSLFVENTTSYRDAYRMQYATKKDHYMIGLNFGPYQSTDFYEYVKKNVIAKAKDVCFRDNYSYHLFHDLPNVRLAPDILFSIDTSAIDIKEEKAVVMVIMDCSRGIGTQYKELYENKIAELTSYFVKQGYYIKYMAFCLPDGDGDAVHSIFQRLNDEVSKYVQTFFYRGDNMSEILDEMGRSEIIVATRFHAIVLGLLFHKVVIPIAYNNKTIHMLKDIGYQGEVFRINDLEKFTIEHIKKVLDYKFDVQMLQQQALEQFKVLDSILERKENI